MMVIPQTERNSVGVLADSDKGEVRCVADFGFVFVSCVRAKLCAMILL